MKRELKYIDIDKLEKLARIISNVIKNSSTSENPAKRKRGRPKTYSDEFILLLLLLQITLRLSFRGLRHYAKFLFRGQKIPEISNLHYRFKKIDEKFLEEAPRGLDKI